VRQWIAARTITYYYYYTHQNFPDALKFDGIISGLVKDYLRGGGNLRLQLIPDTVCLACLDRPPMKNPGYIPARCPSSVR